MTAKTSRRGELKATLFLWAALSASTAAPALELGKMAPADSARLKARTVCSCVFVQRMSLQQCADGQSAIWRYPSPDANPPLLASTDEKLDISRSPTGGLVKLLSRGKTIAQSRYIADGGGCITLPDEASPNAFGPADPARTADVDTGADSPPLPRDSVPEGVSAARIAAILDEGFSANGPMRGRARAAVVVANGRVVADRYATGFGSHNLYYVGSIAKVFNNLLAGLLVQEGRLKVEEPVNLAEWRGVSDSRKRITFDNLLKMASGIEWDEQFWAPGENGYEVYFGGNGGFDVVKYMTARKLEAEPGTHFEYSTGSASLLGAALQRRMDQPGRESLLKYFGARLFAPLEARQVVPEFDPQGHFQSGLAVFIGAEDLARVGLLLANDGVWNGTRILPAGWVDYSRQPAPEDSHYGAQLSLDMANTPGCFGHSGVGESRLVVCPERGLVLVWIASVFDFSGRIPFDGSDQLTHRLVAEFPPRTH